MKRFHRRRGAVQSADLPVPSGAAAPGAPVARAASPKPKDSKPKDDSPSPKADPKKGGQDSPRELLTRPGQSIVDALKETTNSVSDKLDKHFAGWTPNRELAAQTHQKQRLDQDRKDKGLSVDPKASVAGGMPGILMPKPGSDQVQVDVSVREDELQKQIEKAGEPGSVFWSPEIMKSHITDMLGQLHTSEMEELLGEQIELLRAVCTKNSGLAKWLSGHDKDSKDHHEGVKSMVEGLEQRVEKCGRKSETTLYGCQDMGERMVALINAAFAERERVRQLLLSDADIVVTEEKKALLEERRRIGQEMSNKVRLMKQQEDEFGYGGIAEPPAIADLRHRIEKKTKKQNKLKAEQEGVQHRLKSLEQALQAVERGERTDKIHALDQNALETIEEAKGLARQAAIAPLLERMKRERGLESPEPIEMPENMVAEKEYLEQTLAEVEREIEGIDNLRVDWEGQRQAARKTVQYIEDEAEKRLSLFSAKRRRSYLGPMQVEPPLLMPMLPFLVEKAPNIKAGLRRRCREMQEEMEPLMKLLPKYLALAKNAEKTAKELCEQREEFVRHIRSLKPKFLKDVRSGGARKMGNQDINAKLEEEQMMKEVENAWDAEEARLLEGHEALHHRAGFFSVIAAELEEEFNKLEEAVQKNRWAFEDKMALEALHEEQEGEEERGDEATGTRLQRDHQDFELNLPEDEAEPAYVENFLAMEEDESLFLEKAIAAYRIHDEQVLASFIEEGIEVEKQALEERKKEVEDKQVKRDIYISLLRERRNSMAQAMVSPQDSAVTDDSGSNPVSRTASKDTLVEEESPSGRGPSLLRLSSDGHRNKLSLPSGSPKSSRRVQTMPRLTSQGSRPGSANGEGEASSRPSSASSRDSSPSEAGDAISKTTSELGTSGTLRSLQRPRRELGRANTSVESRAGSKSTEKKRSKGKGGKKRSERRASTSSAAASQDKSHEPDDQGDETTSGNRPDAQEDTGASESDVDPQAQGSEHLQQFLKLDRKSSRLEAKVREATEQLSQMRSEVLGENASPLDLDRLEGLAGDEGARAMAQDSVTELRQKWTEVLSRTSDEQPLEAESPKEDRLQTEEEAFQETFAKLMGELDAPVGAEGEPPDAE